MQEHHAVQPGRAGYLSEDVQHSQKEGDAQGGRAGSHRRFSSRQVNGSRTLRQTRSRPKDRFAPNEGLRGWCIGLACVVFFGLFSFLCHTERLLGLEPLALYLLRGTGDPVVYTSVHCHVCRFHVEDFRGRVGGGLNQARNSQHPTSCCVFAPHTTPMSCWSMLHAAGRRGWRRCTRSDVS